MLTEIVHRSNMTSEGLLNQLLKPRWVLGHHGVALLVGQLHGVVAPVEGIVQGGLVTAQLNQILSSHLVVLLERLPEINHVPVITAVVGRFR